MNAPAFDCTALTRLKRMISASRADQVLTLYLELTPLRMVEVQEGLSEQNLERVGRALHDLKSSAGMVGALHVERLALEMEQDAVRQDHAALTGKLQKLASAVSEAQSWVADNNRET